MKRGFLAAAHQGHISESCEGAAKETSDHNGSAAALLYGLCDLDNVFCAAGVGDDHGYILFRHQTGCHGLGVEILHETRFGGDPEEAVKGVQRCDHGIPNPEKPDVARFEKHRDSIPNAVFFYKKHGFSDGRSAKAGNIFFQQIKIRAVLDFGFSVFILPGEAHGQPHFEFLITFELQGPAETEHTGITDINRVAQLGDGHVEHIMGMGQDIVGDFLLRLGKIIIIGRDFAQYLIILQNESPSGCPRQETRERPGSVVLTVSFNCNCMQTDGECQLATF